MPLTLKVTPGYQFSPRERMDRTKLNQLGRPTIDIQGAISSASIGPGTITADKLSPILISQITPGTPVKDDLIMFQDLSANRLAQCPISQLLALSTTALPTVTQIKLDNSAWVIQGGVNGQATIRDFLREAVSGHPLLAAPDQIDPAADMLLLWDASAPADASQNKKASAKNVVSSVTGTLIADTPPMTKTVDGAADEILIRDASEPAGSQQRRMPIGTFLGSQIRAWLHFDGTLVADLVPCVFSENDDVISNSPGPHNFNAGDYIWFDSSNSGSGVIASTGYWVFPTSATQFQIYTDRTAALNQDPSKRVDLTTNASNHRYSKWPTNPIKAASNFAAVIRTREVSNSNHGQFRLYFLTPMSDANYGLLATGCDDATDPANVIAVSTRTAPAVDNFHLIARDDASNLNDAKRITVMIFR